MKPYLVLLIVYITICKGQAEETQDTIPHVEATMNNFTKHPWGIYDWINGFIMGAYAPLVGLGRDDDCFSRFFDWGVRMADMPHYFDKGFKVNEWGDWFGIFFKLFFLSFATYNTSFSCFTERAKNRVIWAKMKGEVKEEEPTWIVEEFQAEDVEKDIDETEKECKLDENGECIPKKDRNLG